jgi:DNA-binding CsgD family transcriptional regulator
MKSLGSMPRLGGVLVGRGSERAEIDALLADARAGHGRVLVLRGDPGIGKTALLGYAAERAEGMLVLRALGVESESELPFSALHELLRPLLGGVDELPERQADALRAAFALASRGDVDRFGVYAAALSLLANSSAQRPLLCLVDDTQWIDASSADAIRFVARRLSSDPVLLLIAARVGEARGFEAPELHELRLTALHAEAAEALLDSGSPALADAVRRRVLETSRGNPLALLEIPRSVADPDDLHIPLPVGRRVEQAFLGRVRTLPKETQKALLVAAAAGTTDPPSIRGALSRLGVDERALDAAERAHLMRTDGDTIGFTHPLVRSAVYAAADPVERRMAHRALADALRAGGQIERYAWQAAAATSAPDEEVATALEEAARAAGARGGEAVKSHAFERAARLTPDRAQRARRLFLSAAASWSIGLDRVESLCREALDLADDPDLRGDIHAELETALYWRGDLPDAHRIKVETADELERTAPVKAAHMRARSTASLKHFLRGGEAVEVADRAMRAVVAADGDDPRVPVMYLQAFARVGALEPAVALLAEWTGRVRSASDSSLRANIAEVLLLQDDVEGAQLLLDDWLRPARDARDVSALTNAMEWKARLEACRGRLIDAHAAALESVELTELVPAEVLQRAESLACLVVVLALLGRDTAARELEKEALRLAARCSSAWLEAEIRAAIGTLALSLGRTDEAIVQLERVRTAVRMGGYHHPAFVQFSPELVIGYVRAGRADDARAEVADLTAEVQRVGTPWALAIGQRCRGLLASGDDFTVSFEEALAHHARSPRLLETALTQLLYGERLRRAGHRVHARDQLRAAHETFEAAGAAAWAERAREELRASGEHVRRDEGLRERLTPQELQVAVAVADGATNKEAATRLFLSPKTIEFHLRNSYRKLGVRSRTELANALRGGELGAKR